MPPNDTPFPRDDAAAVKPPDHPTTVLLEQAVDLMFEIYLMRGDCSVAARSLINRSPGDEMALEHCAQLDDTLAEVFTSLQSTIKNIQKTRRDSPRQADSNLS